MLGDIRVTRDGAILTMICAALIRQLLLKRIYLVMRSLMTESQRARLSPDLFGRAFIEQMGFLLELACGYWNNDWSDRDEVKGWQRYVDRLSRHSRQYHPARLIGATFFSDNQIATVIIHSADDVHLSGCSRSDDNQITLYRASFDDIYRKVGLMWLS